MCSRDTLSARSSNMWVLLADRPDMRPEATLVCAHPAPSLFESFSSESSRIVRLRALFDYYDIDKSGGLDTKQLECLFAEVGLDPQRTPALQDEFGDGDHVISFDALVRLVRRHEGNAPGEPPFERIRRFSLSVVDTFSIDISWLGKLVRSSAHTVPGSRSRDHLRSVFSRYDAFATA